MKRKTTTTNYKKISIHVHCKFAYDAKMNSFLCHVDKAAADPGFLTQQCDSVRDQVLQREERRRETSSVDFADDI